MSILKTIVKKIKIYINAFGAKKRNKLLKCKNFTIISNNCYAGIKYEHLNMAFTSPTIGLYFYAKEYIKFINNLKYYCSQDIEFIKPSESKYYEELKKRNQLDKIIGKIDDVEIVFLHYKSEQEAREKWKKRCKRINYDFVIYKFNDQNLCTYEDLKAFHEFKAKNKICFTAKKHLEFDECIQIEKYKNKEFVLDDTFFNDKYLNFVDYVNYIYKLNVNGKIKILHVLNKMHMGGAETLVMNLYRNIDRTKFDFDFAVSHNGYYDSEIKNLGGKIYIIPEYKIYNHFSYVRFWKQFLLDHNYYDIIHAHIRGAAAIFLKIAKNMGFLTISHSHSISNGNTIKSFLKNITKHRIKNYVDVGLGCSEEANEWQFGRQFSKSEKCFVLKNGIDVKKFKFSLENRNEIRDHLNVKNNEFLIGHVGRFVDVKNHEFMINLFAKITEADKNIKLAFIGDGPLKDKIISLVNEKDLNDNVIFVDSTSEVYKYYSAFDLFVFPSKFEGLGITLIEAQASGLKCIASSTIPKEVKITDNLEFVPLNEELWLKKILTYNKTSKNNNREVRFQNNSYDIKNSAQELEKIYTNLIERKI